ncbi:oleosin Ara h 15.0101-like [Mercurialis annua]|uniref:oleosin Ara h 15.0101-like n=1 Tax=Mercurialis annua TaxID=3986 RepID=UPI00215DEED5|nr:oleosin Ara h 15.0101-like [Mercurialis annua]
MSDQSRMAQMTRETAPTSQQAVKFLTAATLGAACLFLSGLTLTGTVVALIIATPALVLCSPVLVPAAIVIFLVICGFFFSGGCGLAAIMALTWMYNYMTGKHPPGADQLDYARGQIARKAQDMKDRAKEYGQYVQQKAQEATQTQPS